MTEPVAWLVAERRDGRILLGDEWTQRCDTEAEAIAVADQWRSHDDRYDVVILAVTEVVEPPAVPAVLLDVVDRAANDERFGERRARPTRGLEPPVDLVVGHAPGDESGPDPVVAVPRQPTLRDRLA